MITGAGDDAPRPCDRCQEPLAFPEAKYTECGAWLCEDCEDGHDDRCTICMLFEADE